MSIEALQAALEAGPVARMRADAMIISESTYAYGAEQGGAYWTLVKDYKTVLYTVDPDTIKALLAERQALRSALQRITTNYRLTLAGRPVHDVDESLAECDAAMQQENPR